MADNTHYTALRIEVSEEQLARVERDLRDVPNGVNKALIGAVNETLTAGRTMIVKQLTALLTVKSEDIRGSKKKGKGARITIKRATQARPVGLIRILGRRIGLINFKVRDTRPPPESSKPFAGRSLMEVAGLAKRKRRHRGRGVIAQLFRTGPSKRFPEAFIAVGLSENRHVFERVQDRARRKQSKAHHRPNLGRHTQPIESLKGLSLLTVYREQPGLQEEVLDQVRRKFIERVDSKVDFLLGRRKADRPST